MTDEGVAGYGRFGSLSRLELERFFHLDDEDRKLIATRRRDYNRLGFAVQVVTVRIPNPVRPRRRPSGYADELSLPRRGRASVSDDW